ncbi:MAG: hypothetical protein ABID04_03220 [Patescibacteria group bacterium]
MLRIEGGWSAQPEYASSFNQDRCLQACVQMVLTTAGLRFTPEQINQVTGYESGLNSQFSIATIALARHLPETRLYSQLDFVEYATRGEAYLRETYSSEWFEHQKAHSSPSFAKEQTAARQLVQSDLWQYQDLSPESTDSKKMLCEALLATEHILIVSIDAGLLYRFDRPSAHAVLVFGDLLFPEELGVRYGENQGFLLHDPDMPENSGDFLRIPKTKFAETIRTHIIAIPERETN